MQGNNLMQQGLKAIMELEAVSQVRRREYVNRDRAAAMEGLIRDYFSPTQIYNDRRFKTMFRMGRPLFLRIVADMEQHFEYFQQRPDARGYMGFTSLHKCTSAIRHLAFSTPHDLWDDYLKISEKCARDTMYKFCEGMFIDLFICIVFYIIIITLNCVLLLIYIFILL